MIRLTRFFEIALDDREISDARLRDFATDHVARLAANNPGGVFNDILAATDSAVTGFRGKAADEATAAAIRVARTAATTKLMGEIKDLWSRREGKIRDAFGEGSADYLAFYPAGVSEYRQATMDDMSTLLARYAKVATSQATALGTAFIKEWSDLEAKWAAVRGAQVSQKGSTSGAHDAASTARTDLERQLQVNFLSIALQHIGAPDKASVFFTQSLLEVPTSPPEPEPVPPVPAPPGGGA